jgi:hypothetical protein
MTEEQKAAYVFSQSICAMIEAMGMEQENNQRWHLSQSMAYVHSDFKKLLDEYGIHHNAVIERFTT